MALKGDFIGFTFNGIHSSVLGIIRTSNGSRYNSNLLPTSQDQTVAVPGGDGAYFFGSNYTTRVFQLQIASDELNEAKLSAIKQWLGDKQLHELIFDEVPYKIYMAKCTNMPQFNFICFGNRGERIYKGEGSIEFTCYYPYARSRYKFLNEYTWGNVDEWKGDDPADYEKSYVNNKLIHNHVLLNQDMGTPYVINGYDNKAEWADASGMLENNFRDYITIIRPSDEGYQGSGSQHYREDSFEFYKENLYEKSGSQYNITTDNNWNSQKKYYLKTDYDIPARMPGGEHNTYGYSRVFVYNPGDIPADFQLLFATANINRIWLYKQERQNNKNVDVVLNKIYFDFSGSDIPSYVMMDSKTELLTGYNYDNSNEVYVPDNKIYNKCVTKGDFFKIPLTIPQSCYNMRIVLAGNENNATTKSQIIQITYNYLYY